MSFCNVYFIENKKGCIFSSFVNDLRKPNYAFFLIKKVKACKQIKRQNINDEIDL